MKKLLLSIVLAVAVTNVFGATYYWVGGNGTWGTSASFAGTSGGTGSALTPLAADIIVFDANSGNPTITVTGLTISIAQLQLVASSNQTVTLTGTATSFSMSGDLTLGTGCTLNDGGNTISIGGSINGGGTHASLTGGKISMFGNGKSFAAGTYGNFEINGGTSASPISSGAGTIMITQGSTFTVTANGFYRGTNTLNFGNVDAVGTVNIYGSATTNKGNGFYGTFNSVFGCVTNPGILTGLSVNFMSGSTAIYDNTSAQTVSSLSYSNLTIKGARTTTNVTIGNNSGTVSISGIFDISGVTFTTGAFIPGSNTTVNFNGTSAQTIPALNYNNLTISGARTSNNVTLAAGTIAVANTFTASATFTSGTYINTGNTVNFTKAAGGQTIPAINFNNLTVSNTSGTNTLASSGTIGIAGTFSAGSYGYTVTGSTLNFNGTLAQTIPNNFTSLNSLKIDNSAGVALGVATTVNGTLYLTNGQLNNTTYALTMGTAKNVVRTNGTVSSALSGVLNVTYDGSTGLTAGNELPGTINDLTINNSGNVTIANNTNVNGTLTLTSGNIVVPSGKSLTLKGATTGSGFIDAETIGTLSYSGTSTQNVTNLKNNAVYQLYSSNSVGVNLTAETTVNNTLILSSGTLNNSTFNLVIPNGKAISCRGGSLTAQPNFLGNVSITYSNGSSNLQSGYELPTSLTALNNLTINNALGVTLNSATKVNGTLTITTGDLTQAANLTANNLSIALGTTLNIAAGKQLTVSTSMTNNGTINLRSTSTDGTATILTPATIGGTNAANVEQYLASSRNWYMSSPVTGATASAGPTYYKYVEALNNGSTWTAVNSGDGFDVMTGYIVKPTAEATYNFNGTLNTGNKTISGLTSTATAKTGFNLVGNPYPSYVKWSEVVKTNVGETMWYRTHDGSSYKFYTYHPVDGAGGIGVPATVTNYIPPMQAFWVKVTAAQTGSLQFLNSSRDHKDGAGSVFRAPKATDSAMKLLRLQVSNTTENDETVLYFNANASDNLDSYDSQKMFNNNAAIPEIYTIAGAEKLVINGMSDVKYDTEIPLGFVSGQTNSFSIKATELKNFEAGTRIILRDKVDVVDYELNGDNAYTFTSDAVNSTSRFSVLFKSPSVTTDIADAKNSNLNAYVNANNNIVISASEKATYSIYNAMGQLIKNGKLNAKRETLNAKLAAGVYMVNVNNQTTKVIIK